MFFLLFGKQTFAQVKKYKEGIQYHVSLEGIQEIQGKDTGRDKKLLHTRDTGRDKEIREGIRSSYIQGIRDTSLLSLPLFFFEKKTDDKGYYRQDDKRYYRQSVTIVTLCLYPVGPCLLAVACWPLSVAC